MTSQSQQPKQNSQSDDVSIYFIILSPSEEKINFSDLKFLSEIEPEIVYTTNIKNENGSFLSHNVFKLDIKKKEKNKKAVKYQLQYEIGEESYDIIFDYKDGSFIYEVQLLKGNKFIDNIIKREIDQNKIPLHYKLDIFLEALKKNNESDKIDLLFEETIELYKAKKKFSLLVSLFLKIYQQNKELCSNLIEYFKDKNHEENTDRDKDLDVVLNTFNTIYSDAKSLIDENKYDPVSFYGIIFCYLASYDKENFTKIIKDFSEGNATVLYEILIIYYSHFDVPLNQDTEFYNNFVKYAINKGKDFEIFKRILKYIDDIETFIYVINENKVEIFKIYDDLSQKPIVLSSNLKLIKKEYTENKKTKTELDNIISIIEQLIEYSKNNSILAIYLKAGFWKYLLKQYSKPDLTCIDNCYRIRDLFKKYKDLVNDLYDKTSDKNEINRKEDINRYNDRDEFAFDLNLNIKELFELKKDKYNDEEKLGVIKKYNPYYNSDKTEDVKKYQNLRDTDIFNNINFKNPTKEFKLSFKILNFEEAFKEKINEFINKITSKIIDISTFGTIIEIIDTKRIDNDKKYDYYKILKEKYEYIIKTEIESLEDEDKLNNAIDIISNFIRMIFADENNTNFLEEQIKKLNDKLQSLIYFELIKKCDDEKYEAMKDYIFEIFLKNIKETDKIIKLIKILNDKDRAKFLEKLMKVCEFEKNEYYSNYENDKIKLLCKLNDIDNPIINENNCGKLQIILDEIKSDLEEYSITKKQLEEFLNRNKYSEKGKEEAKIEINYNNPIIQKLALIKIILPKFDPQAKYGDYIRLITDINKKIQELKYIKNSLIVFHKRTFNEQIKNLTNIINNIETKTIKEFYVDKMQQDITELCELKTKCDEINKVKDFLLFKKILEKSTGRDQEDRFNDALAKLKFIKTSFEKKKNIETIFKFELEKEEDSKKYANMFENIKDELSKREDSQSDKFIKQMIDYFIINDENKRKDLIIIIKSKKYEMIVKSIKFFIEDGLKKKLKTLPNNIELSKMNLSDLRRTLQDLKDRYIYDYEIDDPFFYEVFTSFYDKKEAIDYLLSKINAKTNFDGLKDKLDPTNRSISIKDIEDSTSCLNQFTELRNKDDIQIIEYLKVLDKDTIKKIISFSKHFPSIKELDSKNEKDIFENIYTIIDDASLTFKLDTEIFRYKNGDEKIEIKIDELINLKNKINIQEDENKKNKRKEDEGEKDIYQIKCDKLIFFKKIISNIEIIYDKIKVLRIKGYNIPILINIEIKYPSIIYKFNKNNEEEEKDFEYIKNYLFTIKNDYEDQLNTIYQNEKHLRFLYGNLFRKVKLHQEGNCPVKDIIRYILNKTDYDNNKIIDGEPYNIKIGADYETEYKEYTKKIFEFMAKYIISLFDKNGLDFEKHYSNMVINSSKKYRGFFIFQCLPISMEEYILHLFQEKLDKLPIAQNILICSNETSIEEIQSFLYRSILCEYNTLFIIEILESFSSFQHNRMYSYIDKLLSIKLEKTIKENKENKNINKLNTREYVDSCIYFIYKNLENETSFLNELEKYTLKNKKKETQGEPNPADGVTQSELKDLNLSNISNASNNSWNSKIIQDNSTLENIKVFSSEVCGLGKSFKIKKTIKEKNEIYYHFPLGGKLSKKIIYEKLLQLLNRIKTDPSIKNKDNKKDENEDEDKDELDLNYDKVAIHLDLIETEDASLINEFLLSFLITKFYTNNEDIIYIPNNIKIYVEIPNSFENYLTKVGILNRFKIDNITLGNLPKLELEENKKNTFKLMLGNEAETDEQIEKFIKDNINLKEYSYYQIQTFINLFISQFEIFNGKIKFSNSQKNDTTKECLKYFADSTIYFTNGGFARLIVDKNKQQKNKIDLCLDAYENDLSKVEFKTPLIFIDNKTKKCRFEKLPDISKEINEELNKKEHAQREVDICYLIDATGSMGREINAANEYVIKIFEELTTKYKDDFKFQFGAIFYRDKIDSKSDKNEYFPLTTDMNSLKNDISKVEPSGGGDTPEDWVEGYNIALSDKMKWRNGMKLIIHIADAGAHGTEFSSGDKYPKEGPKLEKLIKECVDKDINIIGFKTDEEAEQSFEKMSEVYNQYKMSGQNKDKGQFIEIYDFNKNSSKKEGGEDPVSEMFHHIVIEAANQVVNPSYKYLKRLKNILNLPNDLEKDIKDLKSLISILNIGSDNYVITEDNYKKMILLVYRIKANVPVIIMGETGCGKTSLIKKLSQILNNGEELVKIINIHPGITDEEISSRMKEINEAAKKSEYINKEKNIKKELWVFFDEINTCLSLSLLTEIFINRTFNGEKLEKNIRLIGACNPYRRRVFAAEKCGLTREDDKDDDLVYKVEQLPQSLLYFVFSFGTIQDSDEKKYIQSIIHKLFNKEEENLHKLTTDAISKCHIFLRKIFKDPSIVSLREIARFRKCVEFFQDYFIYKSNKKVSSKNSIDDETKKLYKIKSIICSIYLCYYIRLINEEIRGKFDSELQNTMLKIVNVYTNEKTDEENKRNLFDKIRNKKLKEELSDKNIEHFSDLLRIEEEFLLKQVELAPGIGKNESLKENLFLLFLAVVTKIPLIIVGKPGTGKSLSAQLIYNSMRGIYSKNEFFKNYSSIIQIYFQGSESTEPEDVSEVFKKAENLYENFKRNKNSNDKVPIFMILFDELGLAEKSPTNPLKVLHSKLEYDGKNEGVCFVGISNYSLDAAKINRALSLSVPNLEDQLDQLKATSKSIVESISKEISKDPTKIFIFNIISRAYYLYKKYLNFIKKLIVLKKFLKKNEKFKGKNLNQIETQPEYKNLFNLERKIKNEFHGNRDFYNIIKSVALEGSQLNNISDESQIVDIIEKYIERNFGGISNDIDIDFNNQPDDIKDEINNLKEILKEKIDEEEEKIDKVISVYLFKKIYNEACKYENNKTLNLNGSTYKIKEDHLDKYNLNSCINENINDNNSRYLLLEIKSTLAPLINRIIRIQNPDKKSIELINGSPFSDDNNNEYKIKKVGEIQNDAKEEKLVLLQNLDPIQPYLYDLYNMNYKIIDEKKYVRICLDNFSEDLTPVNDSFRVIILVDKRFVNSVDMAFLNRLEKMQINFRDLLDDGQKKLIETIMGNIRLKKEIKKRQSKINYDLNNLLINCSEQEIGGLVYYFSIENKNKKASENDIIEKIYDKISNILPQDIITNLPEDNILKQRYYEKKRYTSFKDYIKDLESARQSQINNYKISIIYTFSNISNIIEGADKTEQIMISEIRTEDKLKNAIDDFKNKNRNEDLNKHIILINFEQYNSNKIQFITDYISNYCKDDDYNYIFIIHIQRSFDNGKKEIIYSIPNIYNNINQLFIDNLQGSNISLRQLLKQNIKDVMFNADAFKNLDNEFRDTLINFVYEQMAEKNKSNNMDDTNFSTFFNENYGENNGTDDVNEEKYIEEILKYMSKNSDFKNDLIKKAKELIDIDPDAKGLCQSLVDKMLEKNYINKDSIDIISCTLDYIKDKIFKKSLLYIFKALEDNNFFTTLIEISKDRNTKLDKNDKSAKNDKNKNIIKELKTKFLKEIKFDNDDKYMPKFLFNYKIPGFYNFYKNLSDYLSQNISNKFYDNEKKLRDNKDEDAKIDFYEKEKELLNKAFEPISQDKLYFDLINKITPDVILKDYIIFYLEKYQGVYSESLRNLIELLLKLRFPEENEIIKENLSNPINIILLKIIWIESNINYIKSILSAFEIAKDIVNDKDGTELNQTIYNIIYNKDCRIKYIVDEVRNPEITREVNECFYILLAGICLSITSKEVILVEIRIKDYHDRLEKIYKILVNINYDLKIYLNELFIIDELIKIIEYQFEKGIKNIENIESIREKLVESSKIIQINNSEKIDNLIVNFLDLNKKLKEEKDEQFKDKYYETLKNIYMQEINKVYEIAYRATVLEQLMKEKEIIKKSNDIFQILLNKYLDKNNIFDAQRKLLNSKDDIIIKLINKNLLNPKAEYYLALSETILYFFEKNSLIYLNFVLNKKKNKQTLLDDPLTIFLDCSDFLNEFKIDVDKFYNKNANITKLFCLGYIRSYCYKFIKMHDKPKFDPKDIIKEINDCDKINMIKLYLYKIIFNLNNKQIDIFLKDEIKEKYKLDKYNNFSEFIKFEGEQLNNEINNEIYDNGDYKTIYKKLADSQKDNFENEITKEELVGDEKLKFDSFFMAANNLILSQLKKNDFENNKIYINFYNNICEPLFKKDDDESDANRLLLLIKFIFDCDRYKEIKQEYNINQKDIDVLFYGYRYCLNEISEKHKKNEEYIYTYIYDQNNLDHIDEKFYPGSNTKEEPYYELYNKIENHFEKIPNQGCYVCLCDKGYYHSVPSGFPSYSEVNNRCPNCQKPIGSTVKYLEEKDEKTNTVRLFKIYETIKRDNYIRIFKDKEEIDILSRNKDKYYKLRDLNYITKEDFKKKYIIPLYNKEKGLNKIDKNNFKKDNKKIRNLSQLSYRLLNYILYSHLFFAKLITQSDQFNDYLPKGMTWFDTIKECFILLNNELEKKGIKKIDIFMNFIFSDLFKALHNQKCITNFEELIDFENNLEKLIQDKFNQAKIKIDKVKELEMKSIKDHNSGIALLKEIYNKDTYNKRDYPYYEYFYYADYIDEGYIENIIEHKDKNDYPILNKYLEYKKKNYDDEDNKYFLSDLSLFNDVLNLFSDKYSNKISREYSEKTIIKDCDIYEPNKDLINDFIDLYNDFKLEINNNEGKKEKLKLDANENYICDLLVIDENKYGKTYKQIYKKYIELQNKELESLLNIKIDKRIFNENCKIKINIQQIKENEIFTFDIPKIFNFISVVCNSSYRKIIDTQNYENYNEYEISLDAIEDIMTDLLLKNKKLLNSEIINFSYDNEVFANEIGDLVKNFKYGDTKISITDKVVFYNYITDNNGNNDKYRIIINNFIALIEYLNKIKKDENNSITGSTKICDIDIVKNQKNISEDFLSIFKNRDDLIVNKVPNMFDYYLKIIFKYIKKDIEKYQEINKANSQNKEDNKGAKVEEKVYLDEKVVKKLDEIFANKDLIIKKESLASAIRLFISLVLYREDEKDKDKRIKSNRKNIVDYLKGKDLWDVSIYKDSAFEKNLEEIKSLNIKIKEILWLYYYLINNKDEGFENEVKEYKIKLEEEEKKKKEEQERIEKQQKEEEENLKSKSRRNRRKQEEEEDDEDEDNNRQGRRRHRNKKDDDDGDDNDEDNTQKSGRGRRRKNSDD